MELQEYQPLIDAISAIVTILLVISFFIMASNVSKIRKGTSQDKAYWLREFRKAEYLQRTDRAKICLEEVLWLEFLDKVDQCNASVRSNNLDDLKNKYQGRLNAIKMKWPEQLV